MPLFKKKIIKLTKRSVPDGLWTKCPECSEMFYKKELEEGLKVCSKCGYHFIINSRERIKLLTDPETFEERDADLYSGDPLQFIDTKTYPERQKSSFLKTGLMDAVITGVAKIDGVKIALAVMEFEFMGGSMGTVVGEKITRAIEYATDKGLPLLILSASGGARMQESTLSLMQMAKTCGALERYQKQNHLFISVLTHPTTGGTTASFAMLGDIIIAEPGALIGFAGARVIKQTIAQELPKNFQTSEFLLEHGFIDLIVERKNLKNKIAQLLHLFEKK